MTYYYKNTDVTNIWIRGPSNFDTTYKNMPSYQQTLDTRIKIDTTLLSSYKVSSNSNLSGAYSIQPNVSVIEQATDVDANISVPSWCNYIKFCLWSRNGPTGPAGTPGTNGANAHADNCPLPQSKRGRTGGAGGTGGPGGAGGKGGFIYSNSAVSQPGIRSYRYVINSSGTFLYLNNGTLTMNNGSIGGTGNNGSPGNNAGGGCQSSPGNAGTAGNTGNAGNNGSGNVGNTAINNVVQGVSDWLSNRIEIWHMTD
jgi:hypothetical protein